MTIIQYIQYTPSIPSILIYINILISFTGLGAWENVSEHRSFEKDKGFNQEREPNASDLRNFRDFPEDHKYTNIKDSAKNLVVAGWSGSVEVEWGVGCGVWGGWRGRRQALGCDVVWMKVEGFGCTY